MKHLYALTLLGALCFTTTAQAQNVEEKEEKQVIVIKKTVDQDGNVNVEKIVTTGEAGDIQLNDDIHAVHVIKSDDISTEDIKEIEIEVEVEENEDNQVIVIKRTVDQDGNVNVEKIVTNGESGDLQLGDDLHGVHVIKADDIATEDIREIQVEVEETDGMKKIWIQHSGEEEIIELEKGEELSEEVKAKLAEKGIHMYGLHEGQEFEDGFGNRIHEMTERIAHLNFSGDHHKERIARAREQSNCVALGVFVGTRDGGAKVSGIIDGSGAEDAGLQSGDLITGINDDKVYSVRSLHEALRKYEPGDVVTVTYDREGQQHQIQSELRHWGDLPDYKDSWRAEVKCGDENFKEEFNFLTTPSVTRKIIIIKKGQDLEEEVPALNVSPVENEVNSYQLPLENFSLFPNPNDGNFRIQFEAPAKPITVSVFDASGREVFRDNMSDFNGFYNKEVDLSNKLRGQAVVSIAQDGKRYSELLIIQ